MDAILYIQAAREELAEKVVLPAKETTSGLPYYVTDVAS